jgi:hypothetical protein
MVTIIRHEDCKLHSTRLEDFTDCFIHLTLHNEDTEHPYQVKPRLVLLYSLTEEDVSFIKLALGIECFLMDDEDATELQKHKTFTVLTHSLDANGVTDHKNTILEI